ncbi:MAG: hypothetical protein A2001_01525 [Treponema sp. GWC1_61_84]|nr:MAG: hypothetical protein A2001_01525 [Treponema sp. GWC1_61_84]
MKNLADLETQVERMREALTPSEHTKYAYIGEFSFPVHQLDEDGNEVTTMQAVPWTTVKEIMAAIRNRAALADSPQAGSVVHEWDSLTKEEMWDAIQEVRTLVGNDGTRSFVDDVRDLVEAQAGSKEVGN